MRNVCIIGFAIAIASAAQGLAADSTACNAASLTGAFGYRLNGSVYDSYGSLYMLAAVGRISSDGNGTITGRHTFSFDGNIAKQDFTGTYTVDADCTGTMTLTTSGNSVLHFDLVIVNNGQEVELAQTDSGYTLTGQMKQQKPVQAQPQTPTPAAPTQ